MDIRERLLRIQFDPNQYYEDSNRKSTEDIYPTLNVLLRRHAKVTSCTDVIHSTNNI
jgi:hypothetical protein